MRLLVSGAHGSLGSPYRSRPLAEPDEPDGARLVEVRVSWGSDELLAVAHLCDGERFELRARGRTDPFALTFIHPSMASGAHTLVSRGSQGDTVTPPGGGSAPLRLPHDGVVRIRHGALQYSVRYVPAAEGLPPRRGDRFVGFSAVLCAAFALCAGASPVAPRRDEAARHRARAELSRWLRAQEREARVYPPTHPDPWAGVEGGTGRRAVGDEGASGRRLAPSVTRSWSRAPRQGPSARRLSVAPDPSRRESVSMGGIFVALGAAPSAPGGAFAPDDRTDSSGAMYGRETGIARGYEGLGLLGTGVGGGSVREGLVGLGRLRTRGHGTDDGAGQGMGGGGFCGCQEGAGLGLRGRVSGAPTVRAAAPGCESEVASGAVRRVVQRNLSQVRRCYESALERAPGAAGRIEARWVIGAGGAVLASSIVSNDTGAAEIAACVERALRRWVFTEPGGCGALTVNYPFELQRLDPL